MVPSHVYFLLSLGINNLATYDLTASIISANGNYYVTWTASDDQGDDLSETTIEILNNQSLEWKVVSIVDPTIVNYEIDMQQL